MNGGSKSKNPIVPARRLSTLQALEWMNGREDRGRTPRKHPLCHPKKDGIQPEIKRSGGRKKRGMREIRGRLNGGGEQTNRNKNWGGGGGANQRKAKLRECKWDSGGGGTSKLRYVGRGGVRLSSMGWIGKASLDYLGRKETLPT